MPELALHGARSSGLAELARSQVADGSISEADTPALLRRVAREELGAAIELRVVVVVAFPVFVPPKDDFALVESEVRPGVRNYRLARVPRNDERSIRIAAFGRGFRRALRVLVRRLTGALGSQTAITPRPEPAFRLQGGREERLALLSGPSRTHRPSCT